MPAVAGAWKVDPDPCGSTDDGALEGAWRMPLLAMGG
jgi:hypothetical protein